MQEEKEENKDIVEYERKLLSTLISNPKLFDIVSSKLKEDDFLNDKNKEIYNCISDILNQGIILTPESLMKKIRDRKSIDFLQGLGYVIELLPLAPLSLSYGFFLENIIEESTRRYIIKKIEEIGQKAKQDKIKDIAVLIENLSIELEKRQIEENEIKDARTLANEYINIVYDRAEKSIMGVETGFADLDELTQGFQKSELIIIGARPSIGKTALAICMLINISIVKKVPAGFFSLEMTGTAIMQRVYAAFGNISNQKLRKSTLTKQDLASIENISDEISSSPLYICDTPNIDLFELKTTSRKMKTLYNIKIIFIDYIGLISASGLENHPRHEQVSFISRNLKTLARELEIPIIVLSQVTRDTEGKAPTLSNLRESGSLEQDADVVMFLHRDRKTHDRDGNDIASIETKLIVAKQRNGPVDDVNLMFLPEYTRFESALPFSENG